MTRLVTYLPAEQAYLVQCGQRHRYRLGPWPELPSAFWHAHDGVWIPSRKAAERVTRAVLQDLPSRWFLSGPSARFGPNVQSPLMRRLADGTHAERHTNQYLLPWAIEEDWDLHHADRYEAALDFQSPIPGRLRVLIKRFRHDHVALLRLLSAVPETEPLATTSPVLFFMLARRFDRAGASAIPRAAVTALLSAPPETVLAACLAEPVTRAAAALITKIPHECIEPDTVQAVGHVVHQPGFGRCLSHLTELTPLLARILGTRRLWPMLTPSLIHEIRHRTGWFRDTNPLAELHRAAGWIEHAADGVSADRWPRFKTADDVRRFLDQFSPQFVVEAAAPEPPPIPDDTPLPPPPMPGNADIVPLLTAGALRAEGAEQKNCCGQEFQIDGARRGLTAFFAMHRPERATLMVTRYDASLTSSQWVLREIRGFENAPTRLATVTYAVNVLGVVAEPVWYPTCEEAWWRDTDFAFRPSIPAQSA